ncbi:hypothetical protein Lxx06290 [Leifsonia xyli subsp. xyli str. CTCB07]|uniref:Uncharacterized protein n=2 Tax=Leifsonia xyli subsp. xyli TaxID=59736 RepID=Q6AGB2_LEIXX|nr:hypothetical protein Lxx06290 [Leifsonia xyli subsp. xyli str. CTCB07]
MESLARSRDARLGEWQPPAGLGPIPGTLHDRARLVLARISASITAVQEELAQLDSRKKMVSIVPALFAADEPQYLDEAL